MFRPFHYFIQNLVVMVNECFILFLAALFCGFLEDGTPDKNLAAAIIAIFSIAIIGTFIIGFIFHVYLIYWKYKSKESVVRLPKPVKILVEALETGRNLHKERPKMREDDEEDEDDFPEKDPRFYVPKSINNQLDIASSYKESNLDMFPDSHFMKSTAAKSRDNERDQVNVFGGNLRNF
jgi:hypothetical protein